MKTPIQIDPLQLAISMGLNVFTAQLSKQSDIFGQIFFRDCTTTVFHPTSGDEVLVRVDKGSILVDPNVMFLRNVGSYNNTIVHGCVHWALHKKHFDLQALYNPELSGVKCTVSGDILGRESESATWMEWQANALAPRIQMPLTSIKVKINEYWNIYREALRERYDDRYTDFCYAASYVIENIANFYGVSKTAAKLRIMEAGYEEAMCALTYLDGAYVPPHSFKKGSLKANETFSISAEEAVIQSLINPKLHEASKFYIFIENHFVLNHPKFISSTENGTFLTEYARYHLDECALKFTLKTKNDINTKFYGFYFLNRDINAQIDLEIKFTGVDAQATDEQLEVLLGEIIHENARILATLTYDSAMVWGKMLEWRGITQIELATRTGISEKTIGKIITGKSKGTLNSVVLMCLGLHLPWDISEHILKISGHGLTYCDDNHVMYKFALQHLYPKSISEIQDFLSKRGVALL